MSFAEKVAKPIEVQLQELTFDKDDFSKPAVAHFNDGTQIEFPVLPKGGKFIFDPHTDRHGEIMERRIRFLPPVDDEGKPTQPSVLIPQYCSPQYVLDAIKRIVDKC